MPEDLSRRSLLGTVGAIGIGAALTGHTPVMAQENPTDGTGPALAALLRLLPRHADQFRLTALSPDPGSPTRGERFRVQGVTGRIEVAATGPAADAGHLANYTNRDWQGLIGDFHLP